MADNQVAKTERKDVNSMSVGEMFESLAPQIARALPAHITPERLSRIALTAVRTTPKLMQCDRYSLMGSIMMAAQLGLEPNTLGQCYLIPYGNQAQFQMGYKGLIELAGRAGLMVDAHPVDVNDTFEYQLGLGKEPYHVPADEPSGETVKYWAEYMMPDGRKNFRVWTRAKAEQHGKRYSKSFSKSDSPWQTSFDAMAMKSVIIDLLRFAPKSAESQLSRAVAADNGVPRLELRGEEVDIPVNFDDIGGGDE